MKCPFDRADCEHYHTDGCLKTFYSNRHPEKPTCYLRSPARAAKLREAP
jgi:hypothetical protein